MVTSAKSRFPLSLLSVTGSRMMSNLSRIALLGGNAVSPTMQSHSLAASQGPENLGFRLSPSFEQ